MKKEILTVIESWSLGTPQFREQLAKDIEEHILKFYEMKRKPKKERRKEDF